VHPVPGWNLLERICCVEHFNLRGMPVGNVRVRVW
jgi:hypothetical protein